MTDTQHMTDAYLSAALAAFAAGRLRFRRPTATVADLRADPDEFPFYPAQAHAQVEMIFALAGRPRIFVDRGWEPYAPGQAWVMLPQTVHSERAHRRAAAYDLLWIVLNSSAVGLHITSFRRGQGYFVREPRYAFHPDALARLPDAVAAAAEGARQGEIRFQALVMDALCQARAGLSAGEELTVTYQRQVVEIVRAHIDAHFRDELPVESLAGLVHYTPSYLNTLFKRLVGESVHQYVMTVRLREADRLLRTTDRSVKQIAFSVGFRDPLYFSRLYRCRHGAPPSRIRQ